MILVMKFFLILFLFLPLALNARSNHLSLGIEAFNQYAGKIQKNTEGTLNYFDPWPFFAVEYFININKKKSFSLHPNISFGIPRKDGDKNTTSYSIVGSFAAGWTLNKFLLQIGLGLGFDLIWGPGGTEKLPNGNDYTEFWLPSRVMTSRNVLINFSADYFFAYNWAIRAGGYLYNLEDNHKRSLSYFFGIHYHFGRKDNE